MNKLIKVVALLSLAALIYIPAASAKPNCPKLQISNLEHLLPVILAEGKGQMFIPSGKLPIKEHNHVHNNHDHLLIMGGAPAVPM